MGALERPRCPLGVIGRGSWGPLHHSGRMEGSAMTVLEKLERIRQSLDQSLIALHEVFGAVASEHLDRLGVLSEARAVQANICIALCYVLAALGIPVPSDDGPLFAKVEGGAQ